MRNYKIYDSSYDTLNGVSTVSIQDSKGNIYTGISTLAEEDKPFASKYTGCRYAKEKAVIKMLKAERLEKKEECENLRKFIHQLQNFKNFDAETPTAKCVFRLMNRKIKEVNNITIEINKRLFELQQDFIKQDYINKRVKDAE